MQSLKVIRTLRKLTILAVLTSISLASSAVAQTMKSAGPKPVTQNSSPKCVATLEADKQGQVGNTFFAEGSVDIRCDNSRLRADYVEWNKETNVIVAKGHVQLDYMGQHVEADNARYELGTGAGTFHNVRATFAIQRRPQPNLLVTNNPLYFEAQKADRVDENTYIVYRAHMTVCDPPRPTWRFYAPRATVNLQKTVRLVNGNFRLVSVPVVYLPYATFPAAKERNSGFMIPIPGESSTKGYILGEGFYWAPTDWMDATIFGAYFSKRGWSQRAEVRMKPWENTNLMANYFAVNDRGLEQPGGLPPINQGGHEAHVLFTSLLPNGWRAVADLDQLTSLTFRLAWSETYVQAVNSEVINNGFLTNNFKGFSLNLAGLSYENFLSAATATTVQTSITLRQAPQVQFSSVDQAPFHNLPVYFSFDSFVGAAYRQESITPFSTPNFVERNELAPSVTVPLHFGSWLDVTPSFTFRSMRYGGQLQNGNYLGVGFFSNAEEFSLVLRPASIERVWGKTSSRWKHVIEPKIEYNYVTGIQDFARIIRFDEYDTLTNTNEIGFGVTQRLYHRSDSGESQELVTWRLYEKYFFDPTFGGALIPGQRNVFETLEALTPFAFADQPRHFSPIVSDLLVEPGKRFDAEFIVNYDPQRGHTTAIGTLLKIKPYKQSFLTVAHLSTINLPILSPTSPTCDVTPFPSICDARANQVRGLLGYGDLTGRGFNATVGASYDISQSDFQNQIIELGYNGSCCGAAFEYRKFAFGQIRNENQYLFVFRIANIGSAGNLRRPEKIF